MADLRVWFQKLRAPDPAIRAAGIEALELLGDTEALPALAEIFATDPDPVLRGLAQKAGKTIYYNAIRQAVETHSASDDERRQAAEILARAKAKRLQNRR